MQLVIQKEGDHIPCWVHNWIVPINFPKTIDPLKLVEPIAQYLHSLNADKPIARHPTIAAKISDNSSFNCFIEAIAEKADNDRKQHCFYERESSANR
jgi:hypothetical protein